MLITTLNWSPFIAVVTGFTLSVLVFAPLYAPALGTFDQLTPLLELLSHWYSTSDTAVAVTLNVTSVSSVVTTPEGFVLAVIPPPACLKSYVPSPSKSLGVV